MPRPRGPKYLEARRVLLHRLGSACFAPGSKFMTSRAVCAEFSLSLQSAHDLLSELTVDGYLERHSTAGTFIPGSSQRYRRAQIVFYPKARNPGSFGGALRRRLLERLKDAKIPFGMSWTDKWAGASKEDYLVLWGTDDKIERAQAAVRRRGLLLNATPGSAVSARYFDSLAIDHFTSGFLAGEVIKNKARFARVVIIANPYGRELWAQPCVLGFRSIWPRARLVHPPEWGRFVMRELAAKLPLQSYEAVFCVTQQNALGLMDYCKDISCPMPLIIAMDRPPMIPAFPLPLVCFSIDDMVETALRVIRARINGDPSPPSHITLAPRMSSSGWVY